MSWKTSSTNSKVTEKLVINVLFDFERAFSRYALPDLCVGQSFRASIDLMTMLDRMGVLSALLWVGEINHFMVIAGGKVYDPAVRELEGKQDAQYPLVFDFSEIPAQYEDIRIFSRIDKEVIQILNGRTLKVANATNRVLAQTLDTIQQENPDVSKEDIMRAIASIITQLNNNINTSKTGE